MAVQPPPRAVTGAAPGKTPRTVIKLRRVAPKASRGGGQRCSRVADPASSLGSVHDAETEHKSEPGCESRSRQEHPLDWAIWPQYYKMLWTRSTRHLCRSWTALPKWARADATSEEDEEEAQRQEAERQTRWKREREEAEKTAEEATPSQGEDLQQLCPSIAESEEETKKTAGQAKPSQGEQVPQLLKPSAAVPRRRQAKPSQGEDVPQLCPRSANTSAATGSVQTRPGPRGRRRTRAESIASSNSVRGESPGPHCPLNILHDAKIQCKCEYQEVVGYPDFTCDVCHQKISSIIDVREGGDTFPSSGEWRNVSGTQRSLGRVWSCRHCEQDLCDACLGSSYPEQYEALKMTGRVS